jgi:hypothetical protein
VPTLAEIDPGALAAAAAKATGCEEIELDDWRQDAIHSAFNQATAGLYRISGTGSVAGETVPWSLILKVVQASDDKFGGSDDPGHANYWKRELLIYQSGLLERIPGVRAPRCFGVEQVNSVVARIWPEDVPDHLGSRWNPAVFDLAARRLGEFNGAYLVGRPLPPAGYLSRHWLRSFVGDFATAFNQLPLLRDHPIVQRCWPDGLLDRVLQLWDERHAFLDTLERLPQTFCHLDAFPRNLLIEHSSQDVVAVDWSFAGVGAIGSELAPMVAATVAFFDAEPERMGTIDRLVFNGYLNGLQKAGWRGDSQVVRLGYTAAASLHYGLFPMGILILDDGLRDRFERVFVHSTADIVDRWARATDFLLARADEARQLMAVV